MPEAINNFPPPMPEAINKTSKNATEKSSWKNYLISAGHAIKQINLGELQSQFAIGFTTGYAFKMFPEFSVPIKVNFLKPYQCKELSWYCNEKTNTMTPSQPSFGPYPGEITSSNECPLIYHSISTGYCPSIKYKYLSPSNFVYAHFTSLVGEIIVQGLAQETIRFLGKHIDKRWHLTDQLNPQTAKRIHTTCTLARIAIGAGVGIYLQACRQGIGPEQGLWSRNSVVHAVVMKCLIAYFGDRMGLEGYAFSTGFSLITA